MTPDEIANHVSVMIEALRDESEKYRGNAYTERVLLDPHVVAAAVAAYLDGINARTVRS